MTAVTLLLEIVIIDLQALRGTTSHFNVGTLLDGVLFTIMGLAIVVQTFSTIAVAVALWRQRFADRAMGWALRLGMTLTIVGAMTGGLMTRPTSAQIEGGAGRQPHDDSRAHTPSELRTADRDCPAPGGASKHGDLRVAHFLGLHAMQLIPLLAFVLRAAAGGTRRGRVRLVLAISASYVALFGLLLWQALRGQSVIAALTSHASCHGFMDTLAAWAALKPRADLGLRAGRSEPVHVNAVVY